MTDKKTLPEISELSFELALGELEEIVRQLEQGKSDLEDAIGAYERGAALRKHCETKLKEAKARVKQRELEFSAAKKLSQKGFKAETKYAAAFADLQAAKAFAERIRINLEYTNIRAPFSGILSAQHAEIGDVLSKSDSVAELIDLDPLLITAYVSERDYLKIKWANLQKLS